MHPRVIHQPPFTGKPGGGAAACSKPDDPDTYAAGSFSRIGRQRATRMGAAESTTSPAHLAQRGPEQPREFVIEKEHDGRQADQPYDDAEAQSGDRVWSWMDCQVRLVTPQNRTTEKMRGPTPRAERFWKAITSQNTAATMDSASKVSPWATAMPRADPGSDLANTGTRLPAVPTALTAATSSSAAPSTISQNAQRLLPDSGRRVSADSGNRFEIRDGAGLVRGCINLLDRGSVRPFWVTATYHAVRDSHHDEMGVRPGIGSSPTTREVFPLPATWPCRRWCAGLNPVLG
jgi:hypothetical protein